MSRQKGTANLSANLEVLAGAPLDSRSIVPTYDDLTVANNFQYSYIGMEVYCLENGKKYRLIGNDVTVSENWHEVKEGSEIDTSTFMKEYSDLSLVPAAEKNSGRFIKYCGSSAVSSGTETIYRGDSARWNGSNWVPERGYKKLSAENYSFTVYARKNITSENVYSFWWSTQLPQSAVGKYVTAHMWCNRRSIAYQYKKFVNNFRLMVAASSSASEYMLGKAYGLRDSSDTYWKQFTSCSLTFLYTSRYEVKAHWVSIDPDLTSNSSDYHDFGVIYEWFPFR